MLTEVGIPQNAWEKRKTIVKRENPHTWAENQRIVTSTQKYIFLANINLVREKNFNSDICEEIMEAIFLYSKMFSHSDYRLSFKITA